MTTFDFHGKIAEALPTVDPSYLATRLQHSALTFEGDRVTLKDTTGFTLSGTAEQVAQHYATHIERTLPSEQQASSPGEQAAAQQPDADALTQAMKDQYKQKNGSANTNPARIARYGPGGSYDPVAAGKAMAEKQKAARDLTDNLAFR